MNKKCFVKEASVLLVLALLLSSVGVLAANTESQTSNTSVKAVSLENDPPYKPKIYGPSNGVTNVEYTFCTDEIVDPDGDQLYCFWDWGDGNNSGWLGPYISGQNNICASHMWTQAGVYEIRLQLKDDGGWESDWSDPFIIIIVENHPPGAPTITGPHAGKIGISYDFTFNAVDPDGDEVKYIIDWGDGNTDTTDLSPSGTDVIVLHIWSKAGCYAIKAKAEDEHGLDGPEATPPYPISITKNKDKAISIPIQNFIQQHSTT